MDKWLKSRSWIGAALAIAVVVLLGVTFLLSANQQPQQQEEGRTVSGGASVKVEEGCELVQTLTYTRCEHTVTRRVTAPPELKGKTLDEVKPLYMDWSITEFGPKEIRMSMQPDLFCPDHMVLMPNAAGLLCVFQNKYGDALALVSELETEIGTLPAAYQEEVRRGMGFRTLDELEQWLESAES